MTQLFKLKNLLLPLMVLGFVGVSVSFLAPVFTTTSRWLLLGLVALFLLARGFWWQPLRSGFGVWTLLFACWSLATVFWSEVPNLSLMKAAAFITVAFSCLAAGQLWVRQHAAGKALDYLVPLTVTALLAGILGRFSTRAVDISGVTVMYQGLVEGSNMFGSMMAMCAPLLVWKTWLNWRLPTTRTLLLLVSAVALYYLLASSSRAAILIVLITLLGLFLSFSLARRLQILILAAGLAANAFMAVPGKFEELQQRYLYKNATREQGVLFTRQEVWQISWQQARKGGWFGGGYGVTIGGPRNFAGGLTAVGYGREKGNSQLAVLEETGIIGFMLYTGSLYALFSRLARRLRTMPRGADRILLATVTAALAGMLAGSVFEAWWVAPGAPESVHFWVLAGIGLGLSAPQRQARQFPALSRPGVPGNPVPVYPRGAG